MHAIEAFGHWAVLGIGHSNFVIPGRMTLAPLGFGLPRHYRFLI